MLSITFIILSSLSYFSYPILKYLHLPSPPGCLYGLYLGFGATTGANFLGGCCVDTEMLGVPKEGVVSIRAGTWPRGSPVLLGGSQDGWDIVGIWNKKNKKKANAIVLWKHENEATYINSLLFHFNLYSIKSWKSWQKKRQKMKKGKKKRKIEHSDELILNTSLLTGTYVSTQHSSGNRYK